MEDEKRVRALETEIEALEKEVRHLVDMDDIHNLRLAYYSLVNEDRLDEAAALFTDDAVVDFGNKLGRAQGKAEIRKKLATLKSQFIKIFPHNHVVEIDGDRADGHLFIEGRLIVDATSFVTAGKVTDTYVRENGRWLIKSMVGEIFYAGTLAEGWAELPNRPHASP